MWTRLTLLATLCTAAYAQDGVRFTDKNTTLQQGIKKADLIGRKFVKVGEVEVEGKGIYDFSCRVDRIDIAAMCRLEKGDLHSQAFDFTLMAGPLFAAGGPWDEIVDSWENNWQNL